MQAARVFSTTCRSAVLRGSRRNYGGGNHHRPITLNDMPVPKGDFKMWDSKRQFGHNLVLAIGVSSITCALLLYASSDVIKFHFSPPDSYE